MTAHVYRFALALVALALGACDGATAPKVAGRTYTVVTVDGQPLPATVSRQGRGLCAPATLYRSTGQFALDGTFEQRFWFSTTDTLDPPIYRMTYEQRPDGSLQLTDGVSTAGFRGATLRLRTFSTHVCLASNWEAVLR